MVGGEAACCGSGGENGCSVSICSYLITVDFKRSWRVLICCVNAPLLVDQRMLGNCAGTFN